MKEKIGKLLELLNEYERKVRKKSVLYPVWFYDENIGFHHGNTEYNLNDEYTALIISKKFGFIKWLVENDKIDLDNQAMQYAKSDLSKFFIEWKDENGMSDDYAMLLMLLAIQDEPIRFLCKLLK